MKKDDNIVIDSRTIYSLAMSVILYEISKSEIISIEFKQVFYIILVGLIIFLIIRGISLAEINDTSKEKILKISDLIYALSFQIFLIFLIVILVFNILGGFYNYFNPPKTFIFKLVFFFLFCIAMFSGIYPWKKIFVISQTKKIVYFIMAMWLIYGFLIIVF